MDDPVAEQVRLQAVRHLRVDFLPKIRFCVESLSEEQMWWRPNERSNSVGNLILHLAGNVRQWVIAALGGSCDGRQREEEFATRGPMPSDQLLRSLEQTIDEAVTVVEKLEPMRLLERHRIQIYEVTALQAILHVVEHFSYHTGQIVYATKLLNDTDLAFYAELDPDRRFQP